MKIPDKLKQVGFNHRVLTYSDFEEFCEREGVFILRCDMREKGMYFVERCPVIAIKDTLTGLELMKVAWHEAVHYLYHEPGFRFFTRGTRSKIELEANDIAICCILPRPVFEGIIRDGDLHHYTTKMIKERESVCVRHDV